MKKNPLIRTLALLLALCALCTVFSSCGNKLKMKKDKFVSSKTGAAYSVVRSVYFPKSVSTEIYATFQMNDVKINYYEVEGLDPEEWLASEQNDLLYAGDISTLPDLSKFGATEMMIAFNADVEFPFLHEKDAERVAAIVNQVAATQPKEKNYYDYNSYHVFFISAQYPALYYRMKLAVTEDRIYLVDTSIGANYDVTSLFADYTELAYYDEGDE